MSANGQGALWRDATRQGRNRAPCEAFAATHRCDDEGAGHCHGSRTCAGSAVRRSDFKMIAGSTRGRGRRIAFRRVADAALAYADALVRRWLPDGRRKGAEWVARNPTRVDRRRGSFKVNVRTGARGATTAMPSQQRWVSIHAPARGATSRVTPASDSSGCFYPRSRAGSDRQRRKVCLDHLVFLSTLPRGERQVKIAARL
jgi:hypothetical protein